MDMTIKEISPETINALLTLAQRNGKSLEEYARSVLERETKNSLAKETNDKKLKVFQEWMSNLSSNTPTLTDEQISRESIYEEQISRQI
jgi:hypothetical protein